MTFAATCNMIGKATFRKGRATIGVAGWGLAVSLVGSAAGCTRTVDHGYDPHVRYAARTDPIVLAAPPEQPTTAPDPLKLVEFLDALPQRGGVVLMPSEVPPDKRDEVKSALEAMFATPAAPRLPEGMDAVGGFRLDAETLAKGSASYRVRCASCHGTSGDGRGSGAGFPYPRDFRSGRFKRTTGIAHNGKPRIDDLRRVIRGGVPGTSMPLFDLLPDEDVDALAAYVVHLSIRGETEAALVRGLHPDAEDSVADVGSAALAIAGGAHRQWAEAQAPETIPAQAALEGEAEAQSIRRGQKLFVANACLSCHEAYGRCDTYRYDIWGLPNKIPNLTQPAYRWGREPADLTRTLRHGIPPANMPAAVLKDDEIADLVNFLRALPFPAKLPPDVRGEVERPMAQRSP